MRTTRHSRTRSEATLSRPLCQPGPLEMVQKEDFLRTLCCPDRRRHPSPPACSLFLETWTSTVRRMMTLSIPCPRPHLPDQILCPFFSQAHL